jgi:MoxR-like ATPase
MAQILLADEINRATPRTQSALLEAMQERQVTVDIATHALPRPFLVMATQNPIELEGTFPLPEAQLDRFLMKVALGYPDAADENAMLVRFERDDPLDTLSAVVGPDDILAMQTDVRRVRVEESVRQYVVDVCRATRQHADILLGASPRATLALYRVCQARAAIAGRDFVIPDDVKATSAHVLTHRLVVNPQTRLRGRTPEDVVREVVNTVRVPVEAM